MPELRPLKPTEEPMRTTESGMEVPTFGRALRLAGRALRLRCPHCGRGRVLGRWGKVRTRCAHCGFRYERSNDSYFTGAMFFNLLIAELLFATGLGITIYATWPDVPWDGLRYGAVLGMAIAPIVMYPVSKVVFLTIDVFLRPVTDEERAVAPARPKRP